MGIESDREEITLESILERLEGTGWLGSITGATVAMHQESTPHSQEATVSGNQQEAIWTPATGKKCRVKYIHYSNLSGSKVKVALRFSTTGTLHFPWACAADGGGVNLNLIGMNWLGGTDEPLYVNLGATATVECCIVGDEVS